MAFLSNFYGGTPDYWLDQPVQAFFAFYREAVKIEARQYSEFADVALIPQMQISYYTKMKERYRRMIDPKAADLPPRPSGPVLEAGSPEAMAAMRNVGKAVKHAMGFRDYG